MKIFVINVIVFLCLVLIIGCNASKKNIQDEINDVSAYDNIQNDINWGISYLGKPVPNNFKKAVWANDYYTYDGDFIIYENYKYNLYVKEDIVIVSQIISSFPKNEIGANMLLENYIHYFIVHDEWQISEESIISIYKETHKDKYIKEFRNDEIYIGTSIFYDPQTWPYYDSTVIVLLANEKNKEYINLSLDRNINRKRGCFF
jgi:hypothetical protein